MFQLRGVQALPGSSHQPPCCINSHAASSRSSRRSKSACRRLRPKQDIVVYYNAPTIFGAAAPKSPRKPGIKTGSRPSPFVMLLLEGPTFFHSREKSSRPVPTQLRFTPASFRKYLSALKTPNMCGVLLAEHPKWTPSSGSPGCPPALEVAQFLHGPAGQSFVVYLRVPMSDGNVCASLLLGLWFKFPEVPVETIATHPRTPSVQGAVCWLKLAQREQVECSFLPYTTCIQLAGFTGILIRGPLLADCLKYKGHLQLTHLPKAPLHSIATRPGAAGFGTVASWC